MKETEDGGTPIYSLIWRQITGLIPNNEYHEWQDFSLQCKRYGITKNKGGILHMLKVYMKVTRITFPKADKCCCDPRTFTDEFLDAVLPILSSMDQERIKELALNRSRDVLSVDEKFGDELNGVITKNIKVAFKT